MIGAMLGDIIGSVYEFEPIKRIDFPLFSKGSSYTDDTIMTLAVMDWLVNKTDLTQTMQRYGRMYPCPVGGYGSGFSKWLKAENPQPYNSWGNGSAMRVSAIGWAFQTLDETVEAARQTAIVSHNHLEGIKGAQATAASIFLARSGKSKEEIKQYIETTFGYNLHRSCDELRPGYHFNESCQETVPEAIIAFLDSSDFENAIRLAVSLGGDSDTLACITGGIAEAFYGVPIELQMKAEEMLPNDFLQLLKRFRHEFGEYISDGKYNAQIRKITKDEWAELFALISNIKSNNLNDLYKWEGGYKDKDGVFVMPCVCYQSPICNLGVLVDKILKINIPFDWNTWTQQFGYNWKNINYASLSLAALCKILYALIRAERFCEGAIARFISDGGLTLLLEEIQKRVMPSRSEDCENECSKTIESKQDDLEMANEIIERAYILLIRKLGAGGLCVQNEMAFQIELGAILRVLGNMYEFQPEDKFTLEFENYINLKEKSNKSGKNRARVDIVIHYKSIKAAIELKFFKKENHREPNNRYDVFNDLSNLEKYKESDMDLCYFMLGTDHMHYVNPPKPYSPDTGDFDFRDGAKYEANKLLEYRTAKPYGGPIQLKQSYDFKWEHINNLHFFKLKI